MPDDALDAIVVGSGPNGLTAAITLAASGLRVRVYEASDGAGGGARTAELTRAGLLHEVCSAVRAFGIGSPAFAALPLADHGLDWIEPTIPLAHPLPDGSAAMLARSVAETATAFGIGGHSYRSLVRPLVGRWWDVADEVMRPVASRWPTHPLLLVRIGVRALPPASVIMRGLRGGAAPALFPGMAGHAGEPLSTPCTAAVCRLRA